MSTPLLQVSAIAKSFDGTPVLRNVSFDVAHGEIVCLLGPSGGGKTTLLYIIAGLEQADSGQTLIEGKDISATPVHRRGFGLMFQDFALFPHKNVYDNVAFGLHMAGQPRQVIQSSVQAALAMVGLPGFETRDVNQLSGGEQQRVALARSLAPRPHLLMLDEPLGSLDRALRERLMHDVRTILKQLGQTALYVTHDQQEAFAIADRVVIVGGGLVLQSGAPADVYCRPASAKVAMFLGMSNLLPGYVIAAGAQALHIQTPMGELEAAAGETGQAHSGTAITLLIRPEAAQAIPLASPTQSNEITVKLIERSFRGSQQRIVVETKQQQRLMFDMEPTALLPSVGERLRLALRPPALICLPVE